MKIVYACDDNYASLTAISAVSLLRHNNCAEIILIGCKLKQESVNIVKKRVESNGGKFTYVDVTAKIEELRSIGTSSYVSYAVYSRIFIAELLPDTHGKVLYLDCDTLVVDSIADVFKTSIHGAPLALAPDATHPAYKKVISLPPDKPYYNTGVALIDLDEWRKRKCTERLMEEIRNPHGKNPLGDQDIIVRVLNEEIIELDRKWNFLSQYILYARKENRPSTIFPEILSAVHGLPHLNTPCANFINPLRQKPNSLLLRNRNNPCLLNTNFNTCCSLFSLGLYFVQSAV
jgi:lipopolysaccharide biosynthesis glycosyltransferase